MSEIVINKNFLKNNLLNLYEEIMKFFLSLEEFKISLKKQNQFLIFSFEFDKKTKEIKFKDSLYKIFFSLPIFKNEDFLDFSENNYCFFSLDISKEKYKIDSFKEVLQVESKNKDDFQKITKKSFNRSLENQQEIEFFIFVFLLFFESLNILTEKDMNENELYNIINKEIEKLKIKDYTTVEIENMFSFNKLLEKLKNFKNFKRSKKLKENFIKDLKSVIFILGIIFIFISYILYKKN